MTRFLVESKMLYTALKASLFKISIFMLFVFVFVIVLGAIMFVVEGGKSGFTSIPQSVYWAIITITTVGYGDIVPQTVAGKFISSFIMLIGYSIIAVPTGIFALQFSKTSHDRAEVSCGKCGHKNTEHAKFCNQCGASVKSLHGHEN
jgi:voltage-gated potassium channel